MTEENIFANPIEQNVALQEIQIVESLTADQLQAQIKAIDVAIAGNQRAIADLLKSEEPTEGGYVSLATAEEENTLKLFQDELDQLNEQKSKLQKRLDSLPVQVVFQGEPASPQPSPKQKRKKPVVPVVAPTAGVFVQEGPGASYVESPLDGLLSFEAKLEFKSLKVTRSKTEGQIFEIVEEMTNPISLNISNLLLTNLNAIPEYNELQNNEIKSVTMQWLPIRPKEDTKRYYSRTICRPNKITFKIDYKSFQNSSLVTIIRTEFENWVKTAIEPYALFKIMDADHVVSWLPITMNRLGNSQVVQSLKYKFKPSLILKRDYDITQSAYDKMFGPDAPVKWSFDALAENRTFEISRSDSAVQKIKKDLNKVRKWEYTVKETGVNYSNNYGILIQMVLPIGKNSTGAQPGIKKVSGIFQYSHQTESPTDIDFGDTLAKVVEFIVKRFQLLDEDFQRQFNLVKPLQEFEIAPFSPEAAQITPPAESDIYDVVNL